MRIAFEKYRAYLQKEQIKANQERNRRANQERNRRANQERSRRPNQRNSRHSLHINSNVNIGTFRQNLEALINTPTQKEQIKFYHKLARKYHPNKTTENKDIRTEQFAKLSNLHNTLLNNKPLE